MKKMAACHYREFCTRLILFNILSCFLSSQEPFYPFVCSRTEFHCATLLPKFTLDLDRFSHLRVSLRKWYAIRNRLTSRRSLLLSGDVETNPGPDVIQKTKLFKICHLNIRSLICHLDELRYFVATTRPDVLGLGETWLDSTIADEEIAISGYQLFRSDRNRLGGGVACYVADQWNSKLISACRVSSGLESIWVSVNSRKLPSNVSIGCFYRPPNSPAESVRDICSTIEDMIVSNKYVIVCGDLNVDLSDSTKPNSKLLMNFITNHSLHSPFVNPPVYQITLVPLLTFS